MNNRKDISKVDIKNQLDKAFDDMELDEQSYEASAFYEHEDGYADSAFSDSAFSDSAFSDSAFSDSAFSDSAFSDSAFSKKNIDASDTGEQRSAQAAAPRGEAREKSAAHDAKKESVQALFDSDVEDIRKKVNARIAKANEEMEQDVLSRFEIPNIDIEEIEKNIKRAKRRKRVRILMVMFLIIIAASGVFLYKDYSSRLYSKCVIEAGGVCQATDFLKPYAIEKGYDVEFTADSEPFDTKLPGTYPVELKSGLFVYKCEVVIKDTVAPVGVVKEVHLEYGASVSPEDFFESITDVNEVTAAFVKEPDYSVYGEQAVSLVLTDASGNSSTYDTKLITRATYEELEIEAGENFPELDSFLVGYQEGAELLTDTSLFDTSFVADYEVEIAVHGMTYKSVVHVVDKTKPVVVPKDVISCLAHEISADKFMESVEDISAVTCEYLSKPDFNQEGTQTVSIRATDVSGNYTEFSAQLTLERDTEPPELHGVKDIMAYVGKTVSYKAGVTATDNIDTDVQIDVDTSAVNLDAEGTYEVIYTATDKSGNKATATAKVTVTVLSYTDEEVYAMADEWLAKCINDNMTELEKVKAIYKYVKAKLGYSSTSDKSSWQKCAYDGFKTSSGDCYTYACVSKAMLTRAGIQNMDINRIPTSYRHYWNLVNIGEGWYHFDTTPRIGGFECCYMSDAELMEYSRNHNDSHNYDKNVWPDIQ